MAKAIITFKKQKNSFAERVREVVRRIPKGKTLTYAEVAFKAGSPGAFRAVGNIMSKNFDKSVPCHRVVRADGKPSGYNRGGWDRKVTILRGERAIVGGKRI